MILPEDGVNIRKIIYCIYEKGKEMPVRVSGELMNVIRDCTKEIR